MNELALLAFVAVPIVAVLVGYIAVRLNERAGANLRHSAGRAKRNPNQVEHVERADEMLRQMSS